MSETVWDGKSVHLCIECYQSSPVAKTQCGLILSTWASEDKVRSWPKEKTSPVSEIDLGYTFSLAKITCEECHRLVKGR